MIGQGSDFWSHAERFSDGNLCLIDMVAPGSRRNCCRKRSPFQLCPSYVLQDSPGEFELIIGRDQGLTDFGQTDLHRQYVRLDGSLIAKTRFNDLQMLLDLFDGGRTAEDVRRATARVREIEAREQRLVLDVELDVRRAYLQLNDAEERLKVTTQAIGQAQESSREIEVRYRGQTATITQLVDGQVALSNARVRHTNAQADLEIARASLERAIGRLARLVDR